MRHSHARVAVTAVQVLFRRATYGVAGHLSVCCLKESVMPQDGHGNTVPPPTDRALQVWTEERAAIQARIDEAIHKAMAAPRAA